MVRNSIKAIAVVALLGAPLAMGAAPPRSEKRIQARMEFSLADGESQQQSSFTIPAGKRLLVDEVAV